MKSAREIMQTVLVALMVVILITIVVSLLTGCLTLNRNTDSDKRQINIEADCNENTLDIKMDADASTDVKGANISK